MKRTFVEHRMVYTLGTIVTTALKIIEWPATALGWNGAQKMFHICPPQEEGLNWPPPWDWKILGEKA